MERREVTPLICFVERVVVVEGATLEETIGIASRTPCAVAHGVVEVWPFEE